MCSTNPNNQSNINKIKNLRNKHIKIIYPL